MLRKLPSLPVASPAEALHMRDLLHSEVARWFPAVQVPAELFSGAKMMNLPQSALPALKRQFAVGVIADGRGRALNVLPYLDLRSPEARASGVASVTFAKVPAKGAYLARTALVSCLGAAANIGATDEFHYLLFEDPRRSLETLLMTLLRYQSSFFGPFETASYHSSSCFEVELEADVSGVPVKSVLYVTGPKNTVLLSHGNIRMRLNNTYGLAPKGISKPHPLFRPVISLNSPSAATLELARQAQAVLVPAGQLTLCYPKLASENGATHWTAPPELIKQGSLRLLAWELGGEFEERRGHSILASSPLGAKYRPIVTPWAPPGEPCGVHQAVLSSDPDNQLYLTCFDWHHAPPKQEVTVIGLRAMATPDGAITVTKTELMCATVYGTIVGGQLGTRVEPMRGIIDVAKSPGLCKVIHAAHVKARTDQCIAPAWIR